MGIADDIDRVERQSRHLIEAQSVKLQELTDRVAALEILIADIKEAIAAISPVAASRQVTELSRRIAAVEQHILSPSTPSQNLLTGTDGC